MFHGPGGQDACVARPVEMPVDAFFSGAVSSITARPTAAPPTFRLITEAKKILIGRQIGAEMHTRMRLNEISAAAFLMVACNGCSMAGGPGGATALDIGSAIIGAAGDLAGPLIPVPYGAVPFNLLAGGMQMAADYKRATARTDRFGHSETAGSVDGAAPPASIGQAGLAERE